MLRRLLADKLRALATRLDGRRVIDARWHESNVSGMNRYISQAEHYIAALESYIERQNTCVVCSCCLCPPDGPPRCEDTCYPDEEQEEAWRAAYTDDPVGTLRKSYGRFDTRPLVDAGAWTT